MQSTTHAVCTVCHVPWHVHYTELHCAAYVWHPIAYLATLAIRHTLRIASTVYHVALHCIALDTAVLIEPHRSTLSAYSEWPAHATSCDMMSHHMALCYITYTLLNYVYACIYIYTDMHHMILHYATLRCIYYYTIWRYITSYIIHHHNVVLHHSILCMVWTLQSRQFPGGFGDMSGESYHTMTYQTTHLAALRITLSHDKFGLGLHRCSIVLLCIMLHSTLMLLDTMPGYGATMIMTITITRTIVDMYPATQATANEMQVRITVTITIADTNTIPHPHTHTHAHTYLHRYYSIALQNMP